MASVGMEKYVRRFTSRIPMHFIKIVERSTDVSKDILTYVTIWKM